MEIFRYNLLGYFGMQLAAIRSPEGRRPNPGVPKGPREPPLLGTPRTALRPRCSSGGAVMAGQGPGS